MTDGDVDAREGLPTAVGPADLTGGAPGVSRAVPRMVERAAVVVFLGYWLLWMSLLAYTWKTYPDLHHGDWFSDANVLNASRNFEQFGLGLNWGLSTHHATHSPDRPAKPYTHYPPGPEWIHEALKTCGLRELGAFRLASVGVAALALLLWFWLVRRLTGSWLIAALAGFFYSWSAPFAQWADSLHQQSYAQLTLFAALLTWLTFEHGPRVRGLRLGWALPAFWFFIDLWLTFEHILFVPLVVLGRALVSGERRVRYGAIAVAAIAPLVLALRVGHNSLALGSMRDALHDLTGSAQYRAGSAEGLEGVKQLAGTWYARLGGRALPRDHYDAEFTYPLFKPRVGWPALILGLMLLATWHWREQMAVRRGMIHGALLLAAGLTWFVAMRNHALHRHVVLLVMPGLALLLASLAGCGLVHLWSTPRWAPRRWAGPLVAFVLVACFGASMRTSQALNQLACLNGRVHAAIQTQRDSLDGIHRAAGGRLREARRIYFIETVYPVLAYAAGRPYEFLIGALPDSPAGDDVIWIERWSEPEKQRANEVFRRYGFPDLMSTPNNCSLIFWGTPQTGETVDLRYENGIRLTRMRCTPTLDEQSWVVEALFEVPAGDAVDVEEVVFCGQVLDAAGSSGVSADARLSSGLRSENETLVWYMLPRSAVPPGARLQVGLRDARTDRAFAVEQDQVALPAGAEWSDEMCSFIWSPFGEERPVR